ncbi:DUF485 domain-containing protein [Streptomyces phyllanthi]|uniref:DUF485 domain-containing protein n=1 Tax=Streptomyces phyllanthi TaxID=1803180 RepID=A0A5N8WAQ0_9ACTN|nr:DUF485 domain-containing protein [Streptomyces phyllanthi]MPY44389.1 DUF485 domain-containing protein [Streptomyces phyllanthi]
MSDGYPPPSHQPPPHRPPGRPGHRPPRHAYQDPDKSPPRHTYQHPYNSPPPQPTYPWAPQEPEHTWTPQDPEHPWAPQEPEHTWAPQGPEPATPHPPRRNSPTRQGDLRTLRHAYRRQRRVATLTALGYFTVFLILSALAPSLMTSTVSGGLSTGLLLGLLQVPVTCLAIWLYERTARRRVDPLADRIRRLAEVDAGRGAAR